jgi:hypothetical protein
MNKTIVALAVGLFTFGAFAQADFQIQQIRQFALGSKNHCRNNGRMDYTSCLERQIDRIISMSTQSDQQQMGHGPAPMAETRIVVAAPAREVFRPAVTNFRAQCRTSNGISGMVYKSAVFETNSRTFDRDARPMSDEVAIRCTQGTADAYEGGCYSTDNLICDEVTELARRNLL